MPTLYQKCRCAGCNKIVPSSAGYCADHKPQDKRRGRRSSKWTAVSRLYRKAHPVCARCGRPSEHVDHIVALQDGGGELDFSNLMPLCRECHEEKTTKVDVLRTLSLQEWLCQCNFDDGLAE